MQRRYSLTESIRIGALISGGGTNLQAIVDACANGRINGKMVFVGTDNPDAGGLARARQVHIPTFVVDYRSIFREARAASFDVKLPDDVDFNDVMAKQNLYDDKIDETRRKHLLSGRVLAEAELLKAMASYSYDLIVLAGFMRNLTPYFIDRVNVERDRPRIMNIHPALLPAFPGIDGYGDTFHYGCKVGGCTVHFIDYGEDSGPIIGQQSFQIQPDDNLDSIRKKGLELEWALYPACIQLFAEGRLRVVKRVFDPGGGRRVERRIVEIV